MIYAFCALAGLTTYTIIILLRQTERLREECQLMRTARSASSQCPLVGHVRINQTNVI